MKGSRATGIGKAAQDGGKISQVGKGSQAGKASQGKASAAAVASQGPKRGRSATSAMSGRSAASGSAAVSVMSILNMGELRKGPGYHERLRRNRYAKKRCLICCMIGFLVFIAVIVAGLTLRGEPVTISYVLPTRTMPRRITTTDIVELLTIFALKNLEDLGKNDLKKNSYSIGFLQTTELTSPPPDPKFVVDDLTTKCRDQYGPCFYYAKRYVDNCFKAKCSSTRFTRRETIFYDNLSSAPYVSAARRMFFVMQTEDDKMAVDVSDGQPCRDPAVTDVETGVCMSGVCTLPKPSEPAIARHIEYYDTNFKPLDAGWESDVNFGNDSCVDWLDGKPAPPLEKNCISGSQCRPFVVRLRRCTNPHFGGTPCTTTQRGEVAHWFDAPIYLKRCTGCSESLAPVECIESKEVTESCSGALSLFKTKNRKIVEGEYARCCLPRGLGVNTPGSFVTQMDGACYSGACYPWTG
uniref:Uncharacterized protein n=1 Tax=Romanomermis culicivorax TaxID=13658 RepID=A0A915KHS4_ROMCU